MPHYVVTPWKFHSELLQVRRELYHLGPDTDMDTRRHAIDWIAAWKQRGALPHDIESTALLVDAVLHHNAEVNSPFSIRATYSAAFCRFVTGFCDISQTASVKRSMFDAARSLDMPASFVELRHEATHDDLPSLQRLVRNTNLALAWLWQHYWVKLDDQLVGSKKTTVAARLEDTPAKPQLQRENLRAILATFSSKRRAEIKASSTDMSAASASGVACLELVKLCRGSTQTLTTLCSLLLEEKMLIPSNRKLNAPMTGAFTIFSNLLRRLTLHITSFVNHLTAAMTNLLTNPSTLSVPLDSYREAIALWLTHILVDNALWRQARIKGRVDKCKGSVMAECVAAPNAWSMQVARALVGKSLGSEDDGDEEFGVRWSALVEAAATAVDEI